MEPQTTVTESVIEPLKKVTPLSKYLAMALFVTMPFLGGYVGYQLAPEKVMEVETITTIVKSPEVEVEKTVNEVIDFLQCRQQVVSGALSQESGAVLVVLGEDKQDGTCHAVLRVATGMGGPEYQLHQCWVPKTVGAISIDVVDEYSQGFPLSDVRTKYCKVLDEWSDGSL